MKKVYSFLLALLPLLIYYDFPFTNIGIPTTISILFLLGAFGQNLRVKQRINKELFFVFSYVFVSTFVVIVLGRRVTFVTALYVFSNLLVSIYLAGDIKSMIDVRFFISSYKKICFVLLSFFFLQHLICLATGRIIFGIIPFLPISDSYLGINVGILNSPRSYGYSIRLLSSLFSEPSHLAVYLLPMLVLSLEEKKKPRVIVFLVTCAAIILTFSGNGILMLAIFIVAYTALCKKVLLRKRILYLLLVFASFALAFVFLNKIPAFNSLISNLFSNSYNKVAKADYRVYRGFYIFGTLPIENKVFGIGLQQITPYLISHNMTTPFDFTGVTNLEYSNFIAQYMMYFGVVGLLPLAFFVVKLFRNGTYYSNAFLISLIALWFSSSMMFDSMWLFFIGFVLVLNVMKKEALYAIERRKTFIFGRNQVYSN